MESKIMTHLTNSKSLSTDTIWSYLCEVLDPEVPVLNVVELGIVRAIDINKNAVEVTITPTYSGCPAMAVIESDIMAKLKEKKISNVSIKTVLSPAWTTDWMKQDAKNKLKEYGIAPPNKDHSCTDPIMGEPKDCPLCGSKNVELKSRFGSTACKSLYVCQDCLEPFDYFKCH